MSKINVNLKSSEYSFIKPFIYKKASITNVCLRMLFLLLIQIVLLFATKSYAALSVIAGTSMGAVIAFLFRYFISNEPLYSVFEILLQGLMMGMLLPETYSPYAAFFISFVMLMIVKYIFTNVYNIWTNLIALGVVIAWFIGKRFFPSFIATADLLSLKNPSLILIQNGVFPVSSFDSSVTSFLNNTVFKLFKVVIPNGYVSFLWDSHSVIPAFRFNIVTILSSLVLFSDDGIDPLIPAIFVFVYALLVRLFVPLFYNGAFNSGDIILAVFSSGTLFCAVFLLQWFGTMPASFVGKIIYAIATGILAFLIVGCGTSSIGMMYTILISNIVTVVIKVVEDNKDLSALRKTLSVAVEA